MGSFLRARNLDIASSELERIAEASQGNPLYLHAVMDQLEREPEYDLQALPASIEVFFKGAIGSVRTGNSSLRSVLGCWRSLVGLCLSPNSVK